MKRFPEIARKILSLGAWVTGGSATEESAPRDLDIMVPYHLWSQVGPLIPKCAVPTSLGGWRWNEGVVSIDVWPMSLHEITAERPGTFKALWHPLSGLRLNVTRPALKSKQDQKREPVIQASPGELSDQAVWVRCKDCGDCSWAEPSQQRDTCPSCKAVNRRRRAMMTLGEARENLSGLLNSVPVASAEATEEAEMRVSKALLWKAFPEGYFPEVGTSTIGGYQCLRKSRSVADYRDINSADEEQVREEAVREEWSEVRSSGDLLPLVNPKNKTTWTALLQSLVLKMDKTLDVNALITFLNRDDGFPSEPSWILVLQGPTPRAWVYRYLDVDPENPALALVKAFIQMNKSMTARGEDSLDLQTSSVTEIVEAPEVIEKAETGISKALLWKAFPEGYFFEVEIITIGGYQLLEGGEHIAIYEELESGDRDTIFRNVAQSEWPKFLSSGDLLPLVDPTNKSAWAALLSALVEKMGGTPALCCEITFYLPDHIIMGDPSDRPWCLQVKGINPIMWTFLGLNVGPENPALALVKAFIQARKKDQS